RDVLIPKTGRHLIPGLIKPFGEGLGDSTNIAHYLEENFPEPAIVPRDPLMSFFAHLLEDFFDEWLTKVFFCMRWSFKEDARQAADYFAQAYAGHDGLTADQIRELMPARLTEQMHRLIGGAKNAPFFHDQFDRIYEVLDAHFADHAYLLGKRPTLADFGFFGQAHQSLFDPTGGGRIRSRFKTVERWIEKVKNLAPASVKGAVDEEDAWCEPDDLGPILRIVEATYLPWMRANADAVAAGESSYKLRFGEYEIEFPAGKYLLKCLNAVDGYYRNVADEEREIVDGLLAWTE
ncbi:MAG: glutathione S-transferase family protein, partial [Vicinamibacteria bacterium]